MNEQKYAIYITRRYDGSATPKRELIAKGVSEVYVNIISQALWKEFVFPYMNDQTAIGLEIEKEDQE